MDTLEYRLVKTRKPHRCWGCERRLPAGTAMFVIVTVDHGEIGRTYVCQTCEAVYREVLSDYNDEPMWGELRQNDPKLWWAEYRRTWPRPAREFPEIKTGLFGRPECRGPKTNQKGSRA